MEKEQPKKCFCARCFLPIDEEDKVDIGGQNFHRMCSTCCVCHQIPKEIKMFYGHVFCAECFKAHVLGHFRGETPMMHSCSWWSQWAPGNPCMKTNMADNKNEKEEQSCKSSNNDEPCKKCICSRCLQPVDDKEKVDIGGQHFHPQCARCYFCNTIPKDKLKIYYGQVFCEDCFHRHVLNRNKDNPSEFFKTCFEQWQNVQFAESMRQFMGCNNKDGSPPFVFCRCAGADWNNAQPQPDARKCEDKDQNKQKAKNELKNLYKQSARHYQWQFAEAMWRQMEANMAGHCRPSVRKTSKIFAAVSPPPVPSIPEDASVEDLYCEYRTEMSDFLETFVEPLEPFDLPAVITAAEKIEKLSKYLKRNPTRAKSAKKWKNFDEPDKISVASSRWVDLQDAKVDKRLDCPKCLWQCGPINVPRDLYDRNVCAHVWQ